ncbi:hypothetical protein C2845_PM09G12410 [Panicum miliaceum]|uniref:Aminotransferase-like plant mobile domain-containing protein n=1 Tax=Panicum miliaceum TaxID=4540 RepID=A0A3L6RW78_PANMI|nr:hypothetical protein C2845_PM09G12410 [Panicum miliaceum]
MATEIQSDVDSHPSPTIDTINTTKDGDNIRGDLKKNELTINKLRNIIIDSATVDDDFKRAFVLFTIGVILAPTTKHFVHSSYLPLVRDVSQIWKFNCGEFTLNNLLEATHTYKEKGSGNISGNLALLQFWYWERIVPNAKYAVNYEPIKPPLMARWEDNNARRRWLAYSHDKLDEGTLVLRPGYGTTQSKNKTTEPPSIPTREGSGGRMPERQQGVTKRQREILKSLAKDARTDIGLEMDKRLLQIEHIFDKKIIAQNEELAKLKKDKRMEGRVSGIEDDIAEMQTDIKVTSIRGVIVLVAI